MASPSSLLKLPNRSAGRRYWSKCDQIYPHFRIEDEISQVDLNEQISLPSMMLIFRGNFTEVVEITTTFTATPTGEKQFDSYIHVNSIVHKIAIFTEEGNYGKFTRQLKELMFPVEIQGEYFEEMKKVEKETGLTPARQLLDAHDAQFVKLKVGYKNRCTARESRRSLIDICSMFILKLIINVSS